MPIELPCRIFLLILLFLIIIYCFRKHYKAKSGKNIGAPREHCRSKKMIVVVKDILFP
nr:Uncharacterised protein [Escherichia coli]